MDILHLLTFAIERHASDLHLSVDMPPLLRIDGELVQLDQPIVTQITLIKLLHELLNDKQQQRFATDLELDFGYSIDDLASFRVHAFQQHRGLAVVFRLLSRTVPTIDELNLPRILTEIVNTNQGLILVTGPTGSGKSSTLAAMLQFINLTQRKHIITIEDPVEFVYRSEKALINQREIHRDSHSFINAMRAALREDPDIIMLGELRDLETIRLAITAAETGHLVLASLHASSAVNAVSRMVDVFPAAEKQLVQSILAASLAAVIAQQLEKCPRGGRFAVMEIMRCTHAIRNLIREHKLEQIYSVIQTSREQGMQTKEQHLADLEARGWKLEARG